MRVNFDAKFFSLECSTKTFAYGIDRMFLETALCQVSNETNGSTTILGWILRSGTLQASPHRIATPASSPKPETVGGMRYFIGAYKVLARVLSNCSRFMTPLDDVVAGRQSNKVISWCDDLGAAFKKHSSHYLAIALSPFRNLMIYFG